MKYFVTSKISDNMRKTPEGFLVCIGVPIARTGMQEYGEDETPVESDDNGMVQIMRDEKEVFRPETLASFEGKPFTLGHPDDMVNPENWKDLAHGTIQNIRRGEGQFNDSLIADILVTSADAIRRIENGVREVSCGYDAEYIQTGIGKGKQTNIIGNHLALVSEARAGSAYAIKDHKGVIKMGLKEAKTKAKAMLAKAHDEAMKLITTAEEDEDEEETVVVKKKRTTDEAPPWADALMKSCNDVMTQISSMSQPSVMGDEEKAEKEKADKEAKDKAAKDADPMQKVMDALDAMGKRLDALEGGKSDDSDPDDMMGDEDPDMMGDEDPDDDDDSTGDEDKTIVGDEKSKMEILAPGLKGTGKDARVKALKKAYTTKDGKAAIDTLTGGKEPKYDSPAIVDMVFNAAAELLKSKRSSSFARTRQGATVKDGHADSMGGAGAGKTADEINKINEEFHAKQRSH